MKEAQIIKAYEAAKERYAQIGIDTDEALKKLQNISLSLHCWQTDDVTGFENPDGQLSGGMQQRVGIARALAIQPDILLMDEPFSALDEFTREKLNDDVLSIWRKTNKTVLFVTHNISESVYMSDRICVLSPHPGRLSAIVDVNLPRPRVPDMRGTPEFAALVEKVRNSFEGI